MAIRIPPDAKIVRESRLTLLRLITTLYDRLVDSDDGMKAKVKATLKDKKAKYAEDDLTVAALRAGAGGSWIDARKLYKLVEAGEITIAQYLDCVAVRKEPLKQYLSGERIEKLSTAGVAPAPSLCIEFKEGVQVDLDRLTDALLGAFEQRPIMSA